MTTTPDPTDEPGGQEPAEGGRDTVDAALAEDRRSPLDPIDDPDSGVSDVVPDA